MITAGLHITRRPATAADETYLRELFADSRDDLALLPDDVRTLLLDMQFDAQRTQRSANYPDSSDEILLLEGREVGRLLLADCHVVDITVGREHRRRGIATAVLREVTTRDPRRDTTLQVWSANAGARALYAELGFELSDDDSSDETGYLSMVHRGIR